MCSHLILTFTGVCHKISNIYTIHNVLAQEDEEQQQEEGKKE